MKPEARVAQILMASVFLVLGGYSLWRSTQGVPMTNGMLVLSAAEVALGLILASGWRLRTMALLATLLVLVDAAVSHPFWKVEGAQQAGQLLHFMKNVGVAGGLLLLSSLVTGRRR